MRGPDDLREGQNLIADHVYERDGGLVIAPMGAGKTVSFLTAFADLVRDGLIDRMVVLAPPKVAAQVWPREPGKWSHLKDIEVFDGTGGPAERHMAMWRWAKSNGILTLSLANAKAVLEELAAYDVSRTLLLIDEISALKAPTGAQAKAVEAAAPRFWAVWGTTGTPRPNGWEDLFRPVRIVTKGVVWGGTSFTDWRRDHFRPMDMKGYQWRIHTFAVRQFEQDIADVAFNVPDEHSHELPELRAGPDFDIIVELPDRARAEYSRMERDLLAKIESDLVKGLSEEERAEAIVVALSKAVASAKMEQIVQGYIYEDGQTLARLHRVKQDALAEMLQANGAEPVVVTYRFKEDLEAIREVWGKSFPVLGDGATAAQAKRHIEAFSRGDVPLLGLHPASAGHGVDGLQQGGRRMIWYCPIWSAEQYDQTVKRLHRPGQTLPTYSHRIVAKDTVDEVKIARVLGKMAEQAAFIALRRRVGQ